jgi:transcriptional regulator of aromatic amino acid metabolism
LSVQDARKRRYKRFLSTEDITDIIHGYQAGETTQEIGARYGISKTRVATTLRKQGITIRRQGLNHEQVDDAATLYASGRSLAWLGARYGVSHTTVATALRRQGLVLRRRPGWI